MGGARKKSISQMMKSQVIETKKEEKGKKKEVKPSKTSEKGEGAIQNLDIESKEFLEEIKKMGAITPYAIASKFGVRISTAKEVLRRLNSRGILQSIGGNNRIRIFRMAST
ncbi:MAG: 30S ribosomal protein S25e [Candidatus Bathyarchaeia archaeon]